GLLAGTFAAALLLTILLTWWRGPLDGVGARLSDGFEFEGLAPIAYTLFAGALALALGAVLRRTAVAVGAALVGFLAARIAVEVWLRPNYAEPVHATWTSGPGPDLHGAWVLSQHAGFELARGGRADASAITTCAGGAKPLMGVGKAVDAAC